MASLATSQTDRAVGTVESVHGSIVDVSFEDHQPGFYHLLQVQSDETVAVEVVMLLDETTVRAAAL